MATGNTKQENRYQAHINIEGRVFLLGYFDSLREARKFRKKADKMLEKSNGKLDTSIENFIKQLRS
jgi:hypothetical protein